MWESISSTDAGLKLNMFKDRLYVETSIYKKITSNLLFSGYSIPYSSGFDVMQLLNGGELQNKGWELMMDVKLINKKKFRWSVYFNSSKNVNTFTKVPDNFNVEKSTAG